VTRRLIFIACLAAAWVIVVGAGPALAGELEDLLERAASAEYSGREIVVTVWDGETAADLVSVEHAGSMMRILDGSGEAVIGEGKVHGDGEAAVAVADWSVWDLNPRYRAGETESVVRNGRPAESVAVLEDETMRARITFDTESGARLTTEVYDGDGTLFRYASMLDFNPWVVAGEGLLGSSDEEFDVLLPTDEVELPPTAAGYQRADVYAGSDGIVQAFYRDGLFSFSVFVLPEARDPGSATTEVMFGGATYRRLVNPAEIWLFWESGGESYVLVGDLPPDHLERVVADLPAPSRRNFFQRIWRGLFG
jgi:hypothetical protein